MKPNILDDLESAGLKVRTVEFEKHLNRLIMWLGVFVGWLVCKCVSDGWTFSYFFAAMVVYTFIRAYRSTK